MNELNGKLDYERKNTVSLTQKGGKWLGEDKSDVEEDKKSRTTEKLFCTSLETCRPGPGDQFMSGENG